MEPFASRRRRLLDQLGNRIGIFPAAVEVVRNRDVEYEFRQDSDFFYLTGFEEPDTIAVLHPSGDDRFVMFVRPKDPEQETWTGRRAGVEGAKERYGADAAFPIGSFEEWLRGAVLGVEGAVYHWGGPIDGRVAGVLRSAQAFHARDGRAVPFQVTDPAPLLHEMRIRKSPEEIELLRRAAAVTASAHREAMRFAHPGVTEREIQAVVEYAFRIGGSARVGYPSIVAGGANATILHYTENDETVADGDLVLIDAGAEYEYYTADVTRTFPVNGRFSPEQRAVYEAVLDAHQTVIRQVAPGLGFQDMHETARRTISEHLVALGLLPFGVEESLAKRHDREFFMHGTGHWLGMDVHDVGAYRTTGGSRTLEPGMVFTVEPGIYITRHVRFSNLEYDIDEWMERRYLLGVEKAKALEAEEREEAGYVDHEVPAAFVGIGIRIEDDILVTGDGYDNLTAAAPVDPDAVESVCRDGR